MDMKKVLPIIALFVLSALLLQACIKERPDDQSCRKALEQLDEVLGREEELAQIKTSRMTGLRQDLELCTNDYDRYLACDNLFEEYFRHDVDSALAYAYLKERIARKSNNPELINDALLDIVRRYLVSGMYYKSLEVLNGIDTLAMMSRQQKATYYQCFNSMYHGLALTVKDNVQKSEYERQEAYYRKRSMAAMTEDMLDYYTIKAGILIDEGKAEQARSLLEQFNTAKERTLYELAISHYWMAKAYREEGRTDKALEEFAISARYDFIGPYKASRSLVQTSKILLEKGQIVRAYNYITRNYRDAVDADARICLDEIAELMPVITSSYESREHRRMQQLRLSLAFALVLLLVSVITLIVVRELQKSVARAHREIQQINGTLEQNVEKLKEANSIKDSYLGRYMSMFSSHINSLERYRSSLRGVAKSMNLQEILQALRSDEFIDQEREILYEEFDHAFLGVFPDFVEQLNSLLEEDKRIGGNLPEGRLSNELRIFALIRLGVSESGKIAQFLKKSPSTIYNYRVKLRNACLTGGEDFEKRLMEIGNT